jgi:lysophospholipase L1-like esterase
MRSLRSLVPSGSALLLLCALAASAQVAAPAPPALDLSKWEADIRAFERADRAAPPPAGGIVFAGSSSIRLWTTVKDDFPGLPVLNRGFGGSQIREVTAFADRIVIPYKPRVIVFYCGSNDVMAGRTVPEVADDFNAFVVKVHSVLPRTRIIYISTAPNPARWTRRNEWVDLNARIAAYTEGDPRLEFVDIWREMLDAAGQPRPELFVEDQLHMNARGYAIWTRVLRPVLEREYSSARVRSPFTPTISTDAIVPVPDDPRSGSRR